MGNTERLLETQGDSGRHRKKLGDTMKLWETQEIPWETQGDYGGHRETLIDTR